MESLFFNHGFFTVLDMLSQSFLMWLFLHRWLALCTVDVLLYPMLVGKLPDGESSMEKQHANHTRALSWGLVSCAFGEFRLDFELWKNCCVQHCFVLFPIEAYRDFSFVVRVS